MNESNDALVKISEANFRVADNCNDSLKCDSPQTALIRDGQNWKVENLDQRVLLELVLASTRQEERGGRFFAESCVAA